MNNDETIKPLLYYCGHESKFSRPGWPRIIIFKFRNVETGEEVALRQSADAEELVEHGFGDFYGDISLAVRDYSILWILGEATVEPVGLNFGDVQSEYQRIFYESGNRQATIDTLLTKFNTKGKSL